MSNPSESNLFKSNLFKLDAENDQFDFGGAVVRPIMTHELFDRLYLREDFRNHKIIKYKISDLDGYSKSIQFDKVKDGVLQTSYHEFQLRQSIIDWHYTIQVKRDDEWTALAAIRRINEINNEEIWKYAVEYLFMIGFLI